MANARIYIEPQELKDLIEIDDLEIIHKIKDVLRLSENSEINIFNGIGQEYVYKVNELNKKKAILSQIRLIAEQAQPQKRIILGFPLTREDRIEFIVQKATELGVAGFVPYISQRSFGRKAPGENKLNRWKKIIIEASRQSGRLWLPEFNKVVDFEKLINQKADFKFVGKPDGGKLTNINLAKDSDIFIVVGPIGDFSSDEYKYLLEHNFKAINLGDNILRVETAAIFFVGLVNYLIV